MTLARTLGITFTVMFLSGCMMQPRLNPNISEERAEMVNRYLSEFCSPGFKGKQIGIAIYNVMMRLPSKDLLIVMDRRRPVIFTEVYDSGTARFASSSEVVITPQDRPAFQEGMTLFKISTALERGTIDDIMGIVAHELAHRVLDHVRTGHVSCKAEREANQLVKTWGFEKEFESASTNFGSAKEGQGVASCQE